MMFGRESVFELAVLGVGASPEVAISNVVDEQVRFRLVNLGRPEMGLRKRALLATATTEKLIVEENRFEKSAK